MTVPVGWKHSPATIERMKELRRARPVPPKPGHRACRTCGVVHPLSEFRAYRAKSGNVAMDWACRSCYNASRRIWKKANRDKVNAMARAWARAYPDRHKKLQIRHKYGITLDDLAAMRERQGNRCAICQRPDSGVRGTSDHLVIDHNHATGKVRDLLCLRCNSGLGYFGESPEVLASAIAYLNRHNGPRKAP